MPRFSKRSLNNLSTCHEDLQLVAHEAIKSFDFTVICGHRTKADQDHAYRIGSSKVRWPNSRHNRFPSVAMDCVPYPLDWNDTDAFIAMAKVIK